MRAISLFFRFLFFWMIFAIPVFMLFIIFERPFFGAIAVGTLLPLFFFDHLFSHHWLYRTLGAKRTHLFGQSMYLFRDVRAYFFLSAHPVRKGVKVWLNEEIISLLPEEELKTLLRKFHVEPFRLQLSFETYVAVWISRFARCIPIANRAWISKGQKVTSPTAAAFPLWSIFWFGCIYLMKRCLGKAALLSGRSIEEKRLIQKVWKLSVSLSGREIPAALESLSVVPIYREAVLNYGRPCLWRKEELEII